MHNISSINYIIFVTGSGYRHKRIGLLLFVVLFFCCESARATFVIHSQAAVGIELTGFNSLVERSIFKGDLAAGSKYEINTTYRGLVLLGFKGGQRYPIIIGDDFFTLDIVAPDNQPTFTGSGENDYFYKSLSGGAPPVPAQADFALLMIQAKDLLESTYAIRSIEELKAKKKELHDFVCKNYGRLKNSDMVRRIIAQYFMMHEYVNYHVEGISVPAIQVQYQKEVVSGVGNWLERLKPFIHEYELLNYCVFLYYQRSMVTLASLIIENFREDAFCPGAERENFIFPNDLSVIDPNSSQKRKLADFKGEKVIAFVSEECPVSMVATISKARRLGRQNNAVPVFVAPLETLSDKHLHMAGMVSTSNMYFVSDDKWRKENLTERVKLPFFAWDKSDSY